MDLDIDFTAPRSKRPFYACLFLILMMFLFTTQINEILREFSCQYIEKLMVFYYDWLGLSQSTMNELSDSFTYAFVYWWFFCFIILTDNKFFAFLAFMQIASIEVIPQTLKAILQDSRPAWTCSNVDISYCKLSFGLPATHVFEATTLWLLISHFTFIHNGYFNRNKHRVWVQILRYLGIGLCFLMIWMVHQTRLVLGAHYIYQDIYGLLGGAAHFYAFYFWFYPWAMDPGREFTWPQSLKISLVCCLLWSFCFCSITFLSVWGLELESNIVENVVEDCSYAKGFVLHHFVLYDMFCSSGCFPVLLAFLPLKKTLTKGHFWFWSLVGVPVFGISTYCYWKISPAEWLRWTPISNYLLLVLLKILLRTLYALVKFLYFALVINFTPRDLFRSSAPETRKEV